MTSVAVPVKPWYKEPWPWILMAGPFVVVIASFVSFGLASSLMNQEGLVSDNPYKEGLEAGQTVARSERAKELGLLATLTLQQDHVQVALAAAADEQQMQMPKTITLNLSHPTRAGMDQSVVLRWNGKRYDGDIRVPTSGHWLVLLEDDAKSWRLMGSVVLPSSGDLVFGGGNPAGNRN